MKKILVLLNLAIFGFCSDFSDIKDPFFTQKAPTLQAIFNDSAMINGKWIKLGQSIDNFKLIAIKDGEVLLRGYGFNSILRLQNAKAD